MKQVPAGSVATQIFRKVVHAQKAAMQAEWTFRVVSLCPTCRSFKAPHQVRDSLHKGETLCSTVCVLCVVVPGLVCSATL